MFSTVWAWSDVYLYPSLSWIWSYTRKLFSSEPSQKHRAAGKMNHLQNILNIYSVPELQQFLGLSSITRVSARRPAESSVKKSTRVASVADTEQPEQLIIIYRGILGLWHFRKFRYLHWMQHHYQRQLLLIYRPDICSSLWMTHLWFKPILPIGYKTPPHWEISQSSSGETVWSEINSVLIHSFTPGKAASAHRGSVHFHSRLCLKLHRRCSHRSALSCSLIQFNHQTVRCCAETLHC